MRFKLVIRRYYFFKIFKRFSNNVYEFELLGEFYIFYIFNVYDLVIFNVDDMFEVRIFLRGRE